MVVALHVEQHPVTEDRRPECARRAGPVLGEGVRVGEHQPCQVRGSATSTPTPGTRTTPRRDTAASTTRATTGWAERISRGLPAAPRVGAASAFTRRPGRRRRRGGGRGRGTTAGCCAGRRHAGVAPRRGRRGHGGARAPADAAHPVDELAVLVDLLDGGAREAAARLVGRGADTDVAARAHPVGPLQLGRPVARTEAAERLAETDDPGQHDALPGGRRTSSVRARIGPVTRSAPARRRADRPRSTRGRQGVGVGAQHVRRPVARSRGARPCRPPRRCPCAARRRS